METKQPTLEHPSRCPNAVESGSYYDPLPWSECTKTKKCWATGHYEMCAIDAGGECPHGY